MPHAAEKLRPSRLDSEHAAHVGPRSTTHLAQAEGVNPLERLPEAASAVPDRPSVGGASTRPEPGQRATARPSGVAQLQRPSECVSGAVKSTECGRPTAQLSGGFAA
jgi:hypothetical protein